MSQLLINDYAQNLKREFPRMPFYPDFWQWAAWGEALMQAHLGFESATPFALARTDTPDEKARGESKKLRPKMPGLLAANGAQIERQSVKVVEKVDIFHKNVGRNR